MPAADLFEVFTSVQGEGLFIGRRQIFVRFACCNLDCPYCDTKYAFSKPHFVKFENAPFSSNFYEERNPIPAFRLNEYIELCFTLDPTIHSVSLTGGEPLLQEEFLEFFLKNYKHDRYFILETNGSLPEHLNKVIDLIDFLSIDIKLFYLKDNNFLNKQRDFFKISARKPTQAKIVITKNDTLDSFQPVFSVLKEASTELPIIIQPDTNERPDIRLLFMLQKEAGKYFKNVLIIPQIHPFLGIK